MLSAHEQMATDYLVEVLAEAEGRLKIYLHSENPGAEHPGAVIDKGGAAHLKIQRRNRSTRELMKLHEYPGVKELLGGHQQTAGDHRQ